MDLPTALREALPAEFHEAYDWAVMRPKSRRMLTAELVLLLMRLVEDLGIENDPTDVSINFTGRLGRIDIATIGADGHLERWLYALNANPLDPAFAEAVSLPLPEGPTQ